VSAAAPPRALERRLVFGLVVGAVALVILIAATIALSPPGGVAPAALSISVTSTGGNWTVRVVASEPLLQIDRVFFLTRTPAGEPFSPLRLLSDLENESYFRDADPTGILNPGDAVILPQAQFPAGLTYWFLEGDRLLAVGALG